MQNKARNWRLYKLAKAWSCRPSQLMDLKDPYAAFCFDEAITEFGETIEDAIEVATEKSKTKKSALSAAQKVLMQHLGVGQVETKQDAARAAKTFASPQVTKK